MLLYHGTFMINSLAHVQGTQRYVTGDDSRKVARQLAASLHTDGFDARLRSARGQLEAALAHHPLPEVPTLGELRARAEAMFARTPSMDQIVARARELLVQARGRRGLGSGAAPA